MIRADEEKWTAHLNTKDVLLKKTHSNRPTRKLLNKYAKYELR